MLRYLAAIVLLLTHTSHSAEIAGRHVVVISIDGLPSYLLDDPQASLPVIRGLMKSGVAASQGMRVSNPSVTWPNHTTLMTGAHPERHGVLFNGRLERQGPGVPARVFPERERKDLVKIPMLFDALNADGQTTAAINWPCTRGASTIDDNFPDVPNALQYTTPRLKDELTERSLLARFDRGGGVVRDEIWTEAAATVIRSRKPALLALHLLNLDGTHHRYGPRTAPGYTAAALTDALVGRVLQALDDAGIRERTAVFVVADHGFAAVTRTVRPNVILRREGLLATEGDRIVAARAHVVPEGGIGMVYLTDPRTTDQDRETVRKLFQNVEGITAVLVSDDFGRYHLPQPGDHPGMADLILVARDGYAINAAASGDAIVVAGETTTGSHGYLSTEPKMNAIFVASGSGIKTGTKLDSLDNIDLAPTVARLLGISLPEASGRVLTEILDDEP